MTSIHQDQDYLLWQDVREGSIKSFHILYERYWETVYKSALKRLRNHDQAQDITQDIFANLWLKKAELQIANLPAYLHVSVRNRVLNLFERERRYIPFEQLIHDNIQLHGDSADAVALRNDFLQAYHTLVDTLPVQRKKIFRYYFEEGLSTDEIAQKLSLSRKTVQNQLGRAVSYLRTNLSQLLVLYILIK
ncbi:sigma-70 family RNA polymerase sigma factor [Chitinophaga sp. MM2321]|uniref:RNA polymerase sigma factor n=1 Tax=Chitinophaga sp. MM2321 TaxID=3137178 RepID=UPI0032D57BC7